MNRSTKRPRPKPVRYKTTRRVEFRDTDAAGIAHFSAFFNYMEQVEHELLRQQGLSVLVRDDGGAISWPRVSASCDYRGAVHFEDVLDVELANRPPRRKEHDLGYFRSHGDRPVAEGQLTRSAAGSIAEPPPDRSPSPRRS